MKSRRKEIAKIQGRCRTVIPWGIGLEFFALYELAGLKHCEIPFLIDNNAAKQQRTVDGYSIQSSETLNSVGPEATVVTTSTLHQQAMLRELAGRPFRGEVLALA